MGTANEPQFIRAAVPETAGRPQQRAGDAVGQSVVHPVVQPASQPASEPASQHVSTREFTSGSSSKNDELMNFSMNLIY